MVKVTSCYISCACNRSPQSADWGKNGLLIYGSCRAIALATVQEPSAIECTLTGHENRVNCVKWINKSEEHETEFVSGSTDTTLRVWRRDGNKKFVTTAILKGHSSSVNSVSAVYVPGKEVSYKPRTLIASASADSTVRIWERKENSDDFECVKCLSLGTGFAIDLSWTILPGTNVPILVYGGDDTKLHLVVEESSGFRAVHTLHGHEDWIRCLDFATNDNGHLILASSSQDCFIRIWRIYPSSDEQQQQQNISSLPIDEEIKLKENTFHVTEAEEKKLCFGVSLESVLLGHENWVYSVRWKPTVKIDGKPHQPMVLLSASMDKTMILWEPDAESGVWIEQTRVGDVGGNTLGFYGGVFGPDGKTILGHGYQGAFHVWHQKEATVWEPGVPLGGHFNSVQDLCWDPEGGKYLLSVSLDQTSRLHAFWPGQDSKQSHWHEVARPQVHGYDIQCLAAVDRFQFASGADEKVIRVFEAPLKFLENFSKLTGTDLSKDIEAKRQSAPEGASVPALGLSNKAVFQSDLNAMQVKEKTSNSAKEQYPEFYFSAVNMIQPPSEDLLLQNTLWPEVQKLYGHGYEIFALASHPRGTVLASACKAAKADHAYIILWDLKTWRQICQLPSHSLTVTQLSFSHQGKYLLSVSRDRTWSLFQSRGADQPESDPLYSRVAWSDKRTGVHSRIIWACAWSHDDRYFVTVSRDKKAVVWEVNSGKAGDSCLGSVAVKTQPLELAQPVTAVDFAPVTHNELYIISFGLEDGSVEIFTWNPNENESSCWSRRSVLSQSEAHHLTVKRIKFSPFLGNPAQSSEPDKKYLQLASCSDDFAVKIYALNLDTL